MEEKEKKLNSDLAVNAFIDIITFLTLSNESKPRRIGISPKRVWRIGLSVL